jgi:peptidyl-prolyl cis-trans isomerase D
MISWMQKNNKFLIITIWIATISFIFSGATTGFSFGIKSSSVGKVGEIELDREKFQMDYRNLYSRYSQMFQGKFDQEQAEKMGLEQQVLNNMAAQAKVLNLAKEFGIVVSDKEVADKLIEIPAFQKEGKFEQSIYKNYIKSNRITTKLFETNIREGMVIEKMFNILNIKPLENELKAFTMPFEIADKIKYFSLLEDDINITVDQSKLKAFWEMRKEQYKTNKQYIFDVVWTESKDINVTEDELLKHYTENGFNYTDSTQKRLSFEEAKEQVTHDVQLEKSKRAAKTKYIAFKKNEIKKDETITYDVNDFRISQSVWKEIASKSTGDILKPKIVNNRYATLKIVDIKEALTKTFKEAQEIVTPIYKSDLSKERLAKLAENTLTNIEKKKGKISNFLTLKNIKEHDLGLNKQESSIFASKLFTSNEEKGIISIGSKIIVYQIVEQKIITIDTNETEGLTQNANRMKSDVFETNLMQTLDKKYPTELYK